MTVAPGFALSQVEAGASRILEDVGFVLLCWWESAGSGGLVDFGFEVDPALGSEGLATVPLFSVFGGRCFQMIVAGRFAAGSCSASQLLLQLLLLLHHQAASKTRKSIESRTFNTFNNSTNLCSRFFSTFHECVWSLRN